MRVVPTPKPSTDDGLPASSLARLLLNDWAKIEFAIDALDIRRKVYDLRLKRIADNHSDEFERELEKLIGTEIRDGGLTFRFNEKTCDFLKLEAREKADESR